MQFLAAGHSTDSHFAISCNCNFVSDLSLYCGKKGILVVTADIKRAPSCDALASYRLSFTE